ncbi:dermonecrotic toxin domain-containing protein [Pseudomonas cannabina]|uniref:dermonecrotic toxin domain-containing protein n=1 Tax=Pseudomonas syringae group TaxID=136849 RepID=UPI0006B8D411|nr:MULTISPECIES: DUF6543 domain-containing protein [Pseudomonas syringae group]KPB74064.1 Uncharacterized protein AC507_5174 [Pseudomonas syringae pv. maculicola]QQN22419.1 hypothetical protein JGS08_01390 [Pseudomonas cannabina pv. alisalensis]UBY96079.1 hypothetical protein LCG56_19000 [Pseudomonas cannabina pv. alisalensis]
MLKAASLGKLARSNEQKALGPDRFSPSTVAVREHRARERADRMIDQFVERFTEKNYFPDDGESALLALLVQLPQWPAELMISVQNESGEDLALYLKGRDESVVENTVVLMHSGDDAYVAPDGASISDDEPLLSLVFSQLPVSSTLGMDGNFPGSNSIAGRIVTLREQIAGLAREQRPLLFAALLADEGTSKSTLNVPLPNLFLPLWDRGEMDISPVLGWLGALNPQVPISRLEELLERVPLTEEQQIDFLKKDALPDDFVEAMEISLDEWTRSTAIDGLSRTRIFNQHTDELARTGARALLAASGLNLVIVDPGMSKHEPTGPDDTSLVLLHDGFGNYSAQDTSNGEITAFKDGTDSFYLAISSQLKAEDRLLLGMQFEQDVAGFRNALTQRAIDANKGWFDPEKPTAIESEFLPEWFSDASDDDKYAWKIAVQDYSQALLEAQAPDLLEPSGYGEPDQLRNYARKKLWERILLDHGVEVNPDEVSVHTVTIEIDPGFFPDLDYEFAGPSEAEAHYDTQQRSLTDLSLENIAVIDLNFLLTSRAFDGQGQLIGFLKAGYLFSLIRDLNIGEDYPRFLRTVLSTSPTGRWHRERYARVMQAQMRLDGIEAKMAGDFMGDGSLPPDLANRGHKWLTAVLDHPVDGDDRATVEGHRVQISQLSINGVPLSGVLAVGVEERASVGTLVMFTPQAPDGKCFREMSSSKELQQLLLEPALLDYLVSKAARSSQADVRRALTVERDALFMELLPHSENFLEAVYDSEVERVISDVDEQTNSNWETNWQSAWEITKTVGDIILTFMPFKVQLPIAAIRSFYAIWQGVSKAASEQGTAPLYFVQAALLLADGLTLSKGRRVKPYSPAAVGRSVLDPKTAVAKMPDGLKLRQDGIYRGIHERTQEGMPSRFYAVQQQKAYAVRYDADSAAWRVIDSRRPDAYYQLPIQLDGQNVWVHASTGLRGGGKHTQPKLPSAVGQPSKAATPNYKIHISDFFESRRFLKVEKNIKATTEGGLEGAVKLSIAKYIDGRSGLHEWHHNGKFNISAKVKMFSLDVNTVGESTGRGDWRLILQQGKGVLEPWGILNHKDLA